MKAKQLLLNLIPIFFDFRTIVRYGVFSRRTPYIPEKEGSIFVLGTGPSLKDSLKRLEEKKLSPTFFALNDFASDKLYQEIRPTNYVIVDPAYFLPEGSICVRDYELREKTFSAFVSTDWDMDLFVPSSVICNFQKSIVGQNKCIHLRPYHQNSIFVMDTKMYYQWLSKNYISCPVGNVLGAAIYLSINMGYKEINILGAEHSWSKDIRVDDQNRVCTVYRHYFEETEELTPWLDPFGQPFSMGQIMKIFSELFNGYEILAKYAKAKGVTINNYTPGSFIDAYNRSQL